MIKKRLSKKIKVLTACSFILVIIIIVTTVITNYNMRSIDATRDTRLDLHQLTMNWVEDDLRSYLTISNHESYDSVKQNIHMTQELKDQLLGSTYNKLSFKSFSSISFVDHQYSIEDKDHLVFYFLTNIVEGDKTKQLNFIVSVKNNVIYDIIAY